MFTDQLGWVIHAAADALHAGTVVINYAPIFRIDTLPFGGVKDSGFGHEGRNMASRV